MTAIGQVPSCLHTIFLTNQKQAYRTGEKSKARSKKQIFAIRHNSEIKEFHIIESETQFIFHTEEHGIIAKHMDFGTILLEF